jgi:hypothetical protein
MPSLADLLSSVVNSKRGGTIADAMLRGGDTGPELGMSDATRSYLQSIGAFPNPNAPGPLDIVRAPTQALAEPLSVLGDLGLRGIGALTRGATAAAGQTKAALTGDETGGENLESNLNDIVDDPGLAMSLGPIGEAAHALVPAATRQIGTKAATLADTLSESMAGNYSGTAGERGGINLGRGREIGGIKAYHGSPYSFDKFDLSKIGTGEGGQAYGHGLYFAENPAVAAEYRSRLAGEPDIRNLRLGDLNIGPHNNFDYNPKGTGLYENIRSSLAEDMLTNTLDLTADPSRVQDMALGLLDDRIKGYRTEWPEGIPDAMKLRADLARRNAVSLKLGPQPGKTYEVNIAADPAHMLDWDKQFSAQPQGAQDLVREKLKQQGYLGPNDNGPRQLTNALKSWKMERGGMSETPIESIVGGRGLIGGSPEDVSASLQGAGVPGIKYLDQGSRGAGTGSSNYVVFDPKIVEILRKYGIVAPLAGGAAALSDDDAAPSPLASQFQVRRPGT